MGKKVGVVTHYYNKLGVAVVKVLVPFALGDKLKISGHDKEFIQNVTSMQIEHQPIEKAKAKTSIGLKVDQAVGENDEIYKAD